MLFVTCPGKPGVKTLASLVSHELGRNVSLKQMSFDAYLNIRFPDMGMKEKNEKRMRSF